MKRKQNKKITVCILLSLLVLSLGGCKEVQETGNRTKKEPKAEAEAQEAAMGRYVEQTIALPTLEEGESVIDFIQKSGSLTLYTYLANSETTGVYYAYKRQADNTWAKEEAAWLNQASGGKNIYLRNMRMDDAEAIYTYYYDDNYLVNVIKTADEKTAQAVSIPDLTVKENLPNGIAVTGSGDIAVCYMSGSMTGYIVLYSGTDGTEIRRFETRDHPTDNVSNYIDASGTSLATVSEDGKSVVVYDTNTGELVDEFETDLEQTMMIDDFMIKVGTNNDYYYVSSVGVNHLKSGGSIMETLIDGTLNSLGMTGVNYRNFAVGNEGQYYVLFTDGESFELVQYVYDETVSTVPAIKLTMYGLMENKSISRAVSTFQKENPDVQIVYYTAQKEGAATTEDSIRTLNTELLSGKGADILLLDGLPVASYIEKGVLADISDVVNPMIEQGLLLENITKGSQGEGGAIYTVPVRFTMPILVGDGRINEAFQSLDGLKNYAMEHAGIEFISSNASTLTYEVLAEFIFHLNYGEIVGASGVPEREKLVAFLETVWETGNAIGATTEAKPKPPATEADIISNQEFKEQYPEYFSLFSLGTFPTDDVYVMGDEIKGIYDMIEPMGLKAQYGRTITSINSQFVPAGTMGINASSQYADRAKEFLACVLSETEQSKDMGDGMPVNAAALASYCDKESDITTGIGYTENGVEKMFTFHWPTKEEIQFMTDLAKTLTEPLNVDRVLKEMIMSEAAAFFEGRVTAGQAADAIFTKANTYLAE